MANDEYISEENRLESLKTTLHSIKNSYYNTLKDINGKEKEIKVSSCGISIINSCKSLGDSFVFSIAEELESCGIDCTCRINHIKDPLDDYIEGMDKIHFPGKMSFVSEGSSLYYENCIRVAASSFESRPVMFSVFKDGEEVDPNHLREMKEYIDSGRKFYAVIPDGDYKNEITVLYSFYFESTKKHPNKTLIDCINTFAQEEKCEEMIKTRQQIRSL